MNRKSTVNMGKKPMSTTATKLRDEAGLSSGKPIASKTTPKKTETPHEVVVGTPTSQPDRGVFKVRRAVSVPILTLAEGEAVIVKMLTPFIEQETIKARIADDSRMDKMGPPKVARVEQYESDGTSLGERSLVGGTVLLRTFGKEYPDEGYVGRFFEIVKVPQDPNMKRAYFRYNVTELHLGE